MRTNYDLKLVNMHTTPLHINPYLEIVLVHKGRVRVLLGQSNFDLTSGEFTIIPLYRLHGYEAQAGSSAIVYLFSPELCTDFSNMCVGKELQNHIFTLPTEAYSYIKTATRDFLEKPYEFLSKSVLYTFLSTFAKNVSFRNMSLDRSNVNRIIEHIFLNIRSDLTAKSVASEFAVSETRLSEMISQYTGLSFRELLSGMRINQAMALLRKSSLNITEIAYESGFETLRTFNRTFLKTVGTTPSEYRKALTVQK